MAACRISLFVAVAVCSFVGWIAALDAPASEAVVVAQKEDKDRKGQSDTDQSNVNPPNPVPPKKVCQPGGTISDQICPNGQRSYMRCSDGTRIIGDCL